MKVLVLLLLSLQGHADQGNCRQYQGFRIKKKGSGGIYQLQLCNSTDNYTTPINLISFNEQGLCDYCNGGEDLECREITACVDQINTFFSNYCETFDHCAATCLPLTTQPTTPTVCTNPEIVSTNVITGRANTLAPAAALGALTGLLLVILVLVVTGWVWTYWTMKKKKKEKQLCKNCQKQEPEEEQFCLNQIHTKTTTQPVVGTAIEQLLHSLEESGQNASRLSSKDNKASGRDDMIISPYNYHGNKGHCDVNRVENFYTSSEGSTNSSLQQEQAVNRVQEGESGEKHMYHVLEKPGSDDYEDPDEDLEENTAMEYDTPLSPKELELKHANTHIN